MKVEGADWSDYDLIDPVSGLKIGDIDIMSADDADGSMVLVFTLGDPDNHLISELQVRPDGEPVKVRVEGVPFRVVPRAGTRP